MSLNILVIDDYEDTRHSLHQLLSSWGHRTFLAADGESAVPLARAYRPDIVLVDLVLPGVDGCEVARRIRPLLPVPEHLIVALTAHIDPVQISAALDAGIDHFFCKPCEAAQLDFLLRRHALHRSTAGPSHWMK